MLTLYNVISADGYIARKDGSEDFIPDELWPTTLDIFKKFDVLVMGRKAYEAVQDYDKKFLEPLEKLSIKKIVVTHNKNFHPNPGYIAVNTPEDALNVSTNTLVCSGQTLNNYLLEKKLVDEIIFHQLPVSIKDGILPFNPEIKKSFILISETQIGLAKEIIYQISS